MESSSNAYLEKKVDQNRYDESDLINIKTKLNLPYYTSSDHYERAYGSINIDGAIYQYVKRRVYKDTLELLCLPNQTSRKLQSVKNELTKSLADGQATTPKKHTTIKISMPDFFQSIKILSTPCSLKRELTFTQRTYLLAGGCILKQRKPPRNI